MYLCTDDKKLDRFKFIITMVVSYGKTPVLVLGIYFFRPDFISDFPLLLHDCNELKSIFPDFVCRKGLPFTKKKSSAISTLWWCLSMVGGKVILGILLW